MIPARPSTRVCPVCEAHGLTSTVVDEGTMMHLLGWAPFCDDSGVEHWHDPNKRATMYKCSRDHRFERIYYIECPSCGYVPASEITVVIS